MDVNVYSSAHREKKEGEKKSHALRIKKQLNVPVRKLNRENRISETHFFRCIKNPSQVWTQSLTPPSHWLVALVSTVIFVVLCLCKNYPLT